MDSQYKTFMEFFNKKAKKKSDNKAALHKTYSNNNKNISKNQINK